MLMHAVSAPAAGSALGENQGGNCSGEKNTEIAHGIRLHKEVACSYASALRAFLIGGKRRAQAGSGLTRGLRGTFRAFT